MTRDVGDPRSATDTVEFLAQLARHRVAAGDSYKALQARTKIPHSTLYDALTGRRRRPRPEVVEQLVRTYASDDAEAEAWLKTWTGLLLAEAGPEAGEGVASPVWSADAQAEPAHAPVRGRRRWLFGALLVPLVVIAVLAKRSDIDSGPGSTQVITVYNVEAACRPLRTLECGLALSRSPWRPTGPDNVAGRVWNGDQLDTDCLVVDGRPITDEMGMSSRHWYHVVVPGTETVGWLPGVRTRNTRNVPYCRSDASVESRARDRGPS